MKYEKARIAYRQTSRDAWDSVLPHLANVDALVVSVIGRHGATSDEVEAITGLKHQTVSAQIRHMVEDGLLEGSGHKRKTRSGRDAIVWRLAHGGVQSTAT